MEWDAYDVLTDGGVRVEVKSAAYLQAWPQAEPSTITFGGLSARSWTSEDGYSVAGSYNADVYVFAVVMAKIHDEYDPLDVRKWSFWVLPRSAVDATGQQSMRLSRVEELAGPSVPYADLAVRVRAATQDDREPR